MHHVGGFLEMGPVSLNHGEKMRHRETPPEIDETPLGKCPKVVWGMSNDGIIKNNEGFSSKSHGEDRVRGIDPWCVHRTRGGAGWERRTPDFTPGGRS